MIVSHKLLECNELIVTHKLLECNEMIVTYKFLDCNELIVTHKLLHFIIKFPFNARSDWLKERALSENRARVDDGKLAFKFLLRNFDKFDPN